MADDNDNNIENGRDPFDDIPPLKTLPKPVLVNGVPISHMAGETQDSITKVIEERTNPRIHQQESQPTPPPRQTPPKAPRAQVESERPEIYVEEPKKGVTKSQVKNQIKKTSGKNAINAFKKAIASGLAPVRIYSADREVLFRELTVTDQKSISKIALENNSRRDIIYNAQCALIDKCADEDGFSISNYTEFDRIVVLMRLYQENYFKNDIKYTCPVCQKENVYHLDFDKILKKLEAAWVPTKVYTVKHQNKEFRISAGWPKVSAVSEFYTAYYRPYNNSSENAKNTLDQLSNVEYLVMFINGIDLIINGNEEISLDLNDYSYTERTDVIDSLPQGIIFDDDDGIISKVVDDFTNPLNKVFQYEKCQYCGAETEEGIGSLADFT